MVLALFLFSSRALAQAVKPELGEPRLIYVDKGVDFYYQNQVFVDNAQPSKELVYAVKGDKKINLYDSSADSQFCGTVSNITISKSVSPDVISLSVASCLGGEGGNFSEYTVRLSDLYYYSVFLGPYRSDLENLIVDGQSWSIMPIIKDGKCMPTSVKDSTHVIGDCALVKKMKPQITGLSLEGKPQYKFKYPLTTYCAQGDAFAGEIRPDIGIRQIGADKQLAKIYFSLEVNVNAQTEKWPKWNWTAQDALRCAETYSAAIIKQKIAIAKYFNANYSLNLNTKKISKEQPRDLLAYETKPVKELNFNGYGQ